MQPTDMGEAEPKKRPKVQVGRTTETVAANITRYRKRAGLTMRGLAEKMSEHGFPMSHTTVSQLENGQRRIDVDDLSRLAYVLDCSESTLLTPHTEDPDEKVGTSANIRDTARMAVYRIYRYSPAEPEWIQVERDKATGAYWNQRLAGIQTAGTLSQVLGFFDEKVDATLSAAYGHVAKKQAEGGDWEEKPGRWGNGDDHDDD